MDFYQLLTGRPSPGRQARRPALRYAGGSVIGEAVGAAGVAPRSPRAPSFPFPMHAGEPDTSDLSPEGVARYEQQRRDIGEYGAAAGRLARDSARHPRLPAGAQEAPAGFPFPLGTGEADNGDVRRAALAVGVPDRYLSNLITQESGGDTNARASTSSATGHAQFIASTWRRMMSDYGPRYGFGEGHLANLSDADVLALRTDPQWAAVMAAEYARENATALRGAIGRDPSDGEVYLAHFLGPGDAAELINAAGQDARRHGRSRRASQFVPADAVEANRSIFFDGSRPRSAAEVVALQTKKFSNQRFSMGDRLAE